MAEIVNLRMARKARSRVDKAQLAAANRAKFGAGKAQRDAARQEAERLGRTLDGAQREK
ncbi:MAG: DUF4169 family protein [Novosphingobium sp.]